MNRIAARILTVLLVVSMGLFVSSVRDAMACPTSDSVQWNTNISTDTANSSGHFDITVSPGTAVPAGVGLNWTFRETPFMGTVDAYSSTGQSNIKVSSNGPPIVYSVTYTPSYFFPTNCTGTLYIQINGDLNNSGSDGWLKSTAIVADSGNPPPSANDIHTLTVYHG